MRRVNRNNSPLKTFLAVLSILLLTFLIVIGGILAYVYFQLRGTADAIYTDDFNSSQSELRETNVDVNNGDPISIVLFGTDDDEARNEKGLGRRSDTIMVVTLNPNTDEGRIVSIPRDTQTEIVGKGTVEKINHAYAYGGPTMAKVTVENFLNVPIDYLVSVNMDGLVEIIDILGGVTITSNDTFEQSNYQFVAGETYNMTGEQALMFSRSRKSIGAGGDAGRQMRQQQVVQAIMDKMVGINTITNFNSILNTTSSNVETNFRLNNMIQLRSKYQDAANNLERLTLEGTDFRSENDGLWYFSPYDESYNYVRNELLYNLELDE